MRNEILGINRRNLEYIYLKNARERFPLVDDKIDAKAILSRAGLPIVRTLAEIDSRKQIAEFLDSVDRGSDFVVKPARGFGGSGISVIRSFQPETSQREAAAFRMAAILSGMFALDSLSDRVLIEELVREDPGIQEFHGGLGVSDLRVLCADNRSIMAMLRLPCAESAPTANLHQGGVGVGIDMITGKTTFGVHHGRPIATHPDTGVVLEGFRIPHWDRIVQIGRCLNETFGLGYLGGDIVVDALHGPLVLEVNARPGLTIQLANQLGLRGPLERVQAKGGGSRA